jgi:hypothetical protein
MDGELTPLEAIRESQDKRSLVKCSHRLEDNIKLDVREIGTEVLSITSPRQGLVTDYSEYDN